MEGVCRGWGGTIYVPDGLDPTDPMNTSLAKQGNKWWRIDILSPNNVEISWPMCAECDTGKKYTPRRMMRGGYRLGP